MRGGEHRASMLGSRGQKRGIVSASRCAASTCQPGSRRTPGVIFLHRQRHGEREQKFHGESGVLSRRGAPSGSKLFGVWKYAPKNTFPALGSPFWVSSTTYEGTPSQRSGTGIILYSGLLKEHNKRCQQFIVGRVNASSTR